MGEMFKSEYDGAKDYPIFVSDDVDFISPKMWEDQEQRRKRIWDMVKDKIDPTKLNAGAITIYSTPAEVPDSGDLKNLWKELP